MENNPSNRPEIRFNTAAFVKSAAKLGQCPENPGIEIAFAGRSNAGKSSALNVLTNNHKLARTSKTPGRTQLINFFSLEHVNLMLVDLPGYGFAKVAQKQKEEWQRNLSEYLENRNTLAALVLMMDIRHPMKEFDEMMIDWARASELPLHILLTKSDKLSKGQASSTLQKIRNELAADKDLISVQTFSSLKKEGVDVLRSKITDWYQASLMS